MREHGNDRLFALKSIIKNHFNVQLHLYLYLHYSPTQFSSCIRKIYIYITKKNIFQLLVTTRIITKVFKNNLKTFISLFLDPV